MSNDSRNDENKNALRRRWIIVCFVLFVLMRSIDAIPWGTVGKDLKLRGLRWMRPAGMTTGPWMMFAPNPTVRDVWLSATIEYHDQSSSEWMSPSWGDVGTLEKFARFREMNYYGRLTSPESQDAAKDFARYLSSTESEKAAVKRTTLDAVELKLIRPAMGGIPSRDEVVRVLRKRTLATVEYQP